MFAQLPGADGMNADRRRTACQGKKTSPPPTRSRNKPIIDLTWIDSLSITCSQHLHPILTRSNGSKLNRIKT
jgi:hypothetical protein